MYDYNLFSISLQAISSCFNQAERVTYLWAAYGYI